MLIIFNIYFGFFAPETALLGFVFPCGMRPKIAGFPYKTTSFSSHFSPTKNCANYS